MRTYTKKIAPYRTFTVFVKTPTDNHGGCTPCFSVTAEERNLRRRGDNQVECCGMLHDEVLEHFPELADVVRLHLSSGEGLPMHAEANGWYWLAGCFDDGLGERFHGGNQETYGRPLDCREILSNHLRIGVRETSDMINTTGHIYRAEGAKAARDNFRQWVADLSERYAREAAECERKYGGKSE